MAKLEMLPIQGWSKWKDRCWDTNCKCFSNYCLGKGGISNIRPYESSLNVVSDNPGQCYSIHSLTDSHRICKLTCMGFKYYTFFPLQMEFPYHFLVLPFFFKTQLCMFSSGSIFGFLFERYIPTVWILALYVCSDVLTASLILWIWNCLVPCHVSYHWSENYDIFSLAITVCMIYWTEIDTPYIFL